MILPPLVGGVPQSLNLVFYVVNAGKQFAMEVDPHSLQMEEEVLEGALEGAAFVYVVSTSKFVVVPLSDPNPAVLIFEQ